MATAYKTYGRSRQPKDITFLHKNKLLSPKRSRSSLPTDHLLTN